MIPETGCVVGQAFGGNANPSYHAGGLIGHTGWDEKCGYGSPIKALTSGKVYSLYTPQNPANDGYTAVYTLCRTALETFEFSYGHVSEIDVQIGQDVHVGDIIAKEGNHGIVYSGSHLVTLAEQAAGSHEGSHRHYQKRPTIAAPITHGQMLQTAQGTYRDEDGNYHIVPMYKNGFNGCVDFEAPLFRVDMKYGDEHYYVLLLQRALVLEGYASFIPNGHFGPATRSAVQAYQTAHHLPTTGLCGPMTRTSLNAKYKQL